VWVWSYGTAFVHVGADAPPPATLRVATFNTYVGALGVDHVVDLVDRHDPDVLLLQEVFGDREAELTAALSDRYPTQLYVASPGVGAVAVLSRHDVVEVRDVGEAGERSRATRVVVLDVGGTAVQVVPLHLLSPCPTCGTSLLERLELEGDVRRAEIATVVAALDDDLPAIVGGDLNSNDRSEPYRRLVAAGFRDPQRERGSGMGFTWPEGGTMPTWLRIDWLLVRGLEPVDAFVAEGGGSDHRPVVVDLAVPDPAED
jgi:endonuclease/exonuclease/phosphatase (EEP) superfamily protein YafD